MGGGGTGRTISGDGATLTTTDPQNYIFRGRSTVVRTGPGVSLDIGVRIATGPNGVSTGGETIAVGSVQELVPFVYKYSSNPGVAFHYNLYCGGVNKEHGNSDGLYKFPGAHNTVHRIVLHVRGTTLTFSAGPEAGPVTLQAGSWPIPPDFYVLLGWCYSGAAVTLSMA